jgi:hypothetical protein
VRRLYACGSCYGDSVQALDNCVQAAAGGACAAQAGNAFGPCVPDYADGGSAVSPKECNNGDMRAVANVICGTGP